MKILIDNHPLEGVPPLAQNFGEFCQKIMALLLEKNLSIKSCAFDGVEVANLDEANELFLHSQICKIESVPLAQAMGNVLEAKCEEARILEADCEEMVTQALLAKPEEIVQRWHDICEEIKSLVGFLPRLTGLLTEAQVDQLVDRQLSELSVAMRSLSDAFNKGDTLEISDIIELQLLPWLRQLREFYETCLNLTKTLSS